MAAKNEAKIRFSAETKDFDAGIKSANSTLKSLSNELKLNEAQMKANGASIEGLKEKQQNLAAQMDAAQDKTKALSDKLEVAVAVFGENSTEADKLRNQLLNAQTAEAKLQTAINNCNAELERQEQAAKEAESATGKLADEIADQEDELQRLKRAYADYVANGEKSSREAKNLAKEIDKLSGDLKENKFAMERAEKAADELDNTIDDLGDSAGEAGEGFTVFKGALADLVSSGIQSTISGIGNLASSFLELSESTQEHRVAMATLGASFEEAGHEYDYAIDTLFELQGVLGDTDRAVEASNFLAKVSQDEQDLAENTRILTGVFALYGESIPTEGLAEGIAATAEMGSVQGVLADALEWQGVNLDDFNKRLEKMKTSEERAAFVQQTLSEIYGETADAYRENNADMIAANEAQLRYNDALAELGNKSQPITTGLKNGWAQVLMSVRSLVDGVDFNAIGVSIENAFRWFADEGIPVIVQGVKDLITWLGEAKTFIEEYSGLLTAVAVAIGVVTAAIALQNTVNAIKAAMDAAQVTTIWGLVAAHWAQATAAMAALAPYILIVAAIAAVIAIIVLCIKHWDEIVAAVKNAWDAIKATLAVWGEWINANVIQPIAEFFSGLWDGITSTCAAAWGWIKSTTSRDWNGIKSVISNIWNGIKSGVSSAVDGVKSAVSNAFNAVKTTATSIWNGIKTAIMDPINDAKDAVKTAIDKIKGFFNFSWSLPKLKMPHFSIKGKFSLDPPSVPKFSIDWYKDGGIMTNPTIFGVNGNRLMAGGEAGPEAILPIDRLQGYISSAIDKTMQVSNIHALVAAVEDLANRPIELNVNGRKFAVATAADTDSVNGNRLALSKRGLAL